MKIDKQRGGESCRPRLSMRGKYKWDSRGNLLSPTFNKGVHGNGVTLERGVSFFSSGVRTIAGSPEGFPSGLKVIMGVVFNNRGLIMKKRVVECGKKRLGGGKQPVRNRKSYPGVYGPSRNTGLLHRGESDLVWPEVQVRAKKKTEHLEEILYRGRQIPSYKTNKRQKEVQRTDNRPTKRGMAVIHVRVGLATLYKRRKRFKWKHPTEVRKTPPGGPPSLVKNAKPATKEKRQWGVPQKSAEAFRFAPIVEG